MSKKASAECKVYFPDERSLEIVFRALKPEVRKPATFRSRAYIKKDGAFLVLKVEARDTVALRAALNAYLRWINSMTIVLKVLEKL